MKKYVKQTTVARSHQLNNGSRVVNLDMLRQNLQKVTTHVANCQPCINRALQQKQAIIISSENRAGLASLFTIRCLGCNDEFSMATSLKARGCNGVIYWESNLAAVWGQMVCGGGHSSLTEALAVIGIPVIIASSAIGRH